MRKKYIVVSMIVLCSSCTIKELNVAVPKEVSVEYGEDLEYQKLYDRKKSDQNIQVKKIEGFNNQQLGKQEIKVIFTDNKKEIMKKIEINVKDTKKPVIKLDKKVMKINVGEQVDVKKNIKKVFDYVDGNLKYKNFQIKENGYMIDQNKLNLKKVGTYEIKVIAYDQNKNKTVATFKVIVENKKNTHQQKESVSHINELIEEKIPSKKPMIQSNQSNDDSIEQKSNHMPHTCRVGILPKGAWIGNSEMIFKSMQEAGEWGSSENINGGKWDVTNGWEGFSVVECLDECGNCVYTVDFYK